MDLLDVYVMISLGNILTLVNISFTDQQNLSAVQIGNEIWYRVIRPIAHAAEFMVYYGEGKRGESTVF